MVERKHWQLCKKQKVSLRGVYLWAVNSTVTKHSDYFVWKDTQEHVTWWCNDTSWQEANKFLCMKTPFGGSSATKNNRQRTRKCCLWDSISEFGNTLRPPVSCFQNSEAGNMKPLFALFYWLMNELPYLFWSKDSEKLFASLLPRPANSANFWREYVCLSPGQNSLWIQVTSFTVKQILL